MARRSSTKGSAVLTVRGGEELVRKLARVGGVERIAASKALATVARKVQADARRFAPRRTGRLAGSIAVGTTEADVYHKSRAVSRSPSGWRIADSKLPKVLDAEAKGLRAYIGTSLAYSFAAEFGRRPHTIQPETGRAVKFIGTDGETFAVVVHHPGQSAQPFIFPAGELARPALPLQLKRELRASLQELAE